MGLLSWLGADNSYHAETDDTKLENKDELTGMARDRYAAAGNRQATQVNGSHANAAQVATGPQNEVRGQQGQLANALMQRALGTGGPSAAETQLRGSTDRNLRQQQAVAAGARGGQSPLMMKNQQAQGALTNQTAAGQAAELRANEQIAAQQGLGSVLSGQRGQDIGLASTQAGLTQQANLTNAQLQQQAAMGNQQANLQQTSLNDNAQQNAQQNMFNVGRADQQAELQAQNINSGIAASNAAAEAGFMGGLLNTGGGIAGAAIMASDERAKTGVKKVDVMKPGTTSEQWEEDHRDPFEVEDEKRAKKRAADASSSMDWKKGLAAALSHVGDGLMVSDERQKTDITHMTGAQEDKLKKAKREDKDRTAMWAAQHEQRRAQAEARFKTGIGPDPAEGDSEAFRRYSAQVEPEHAAEDAAYYEKEKRDAAQEQKDRNMRAGQKKLGLLPSDIRVKADITNASPSQIDRLADKLVPYEFRYKDEERFGRGKRTGVMAQDVEKGGPLGRDMVGELPDGTKAIDVPKALGFALAAIGQLHDEMSKGKKR